MAETIALIILIILALILTVACFFYAGLLIGLIQARGVPFVRLPKSIVSDCISRMDLKKGAIVYDLGCGDGRVLFLVDKKFPSLELRGYEICWTPFVLARIQRRLRKSRVQIKRKNFFEQDLSDADLVFCYLFPEPMQKLRQKFDKELKSGAKVFSVAFPIKNWYMPEVVDFNKPWGKLYIYTIK